MHCVFQRHWHSSVRLEEQKLLAEAAYCGTDREVCARLIVDPKTFIIEKADWEKYRTPKEKGWKLTNLPQLEGIEAYFNSGKAIREALAPLGEPYVYDLVAEAVRAIIQGETFIFKKRGYPSKEDYQGFWGTFYADSCRYFSNLKALTKGWFEHIGYDDRRGSLFNRMKSVTLYLDENSYLLIGHLNDSFHSISTELRLEKDKLNVISAKGDLLRVPDQVCAEAESFMKNLEGKSLTGAKKKEIALLLGGGDGCIHLIDLVYDGLHILELLPLIAV